MINNKFTRMALGVFAAAFVAGSISGLTARADSQDSATSSYALQKQALLAQLGLVVNLDGAWAGVFEADPEAYIAYRNSLMAQIASVDLTGEYASWSYTDPSEYAGYDFSADAEESFSLQQYMQNKAAYLGASADAYAAAGNSAGSSAASAASVSSSGSQASYSAPAAAASYAATPVYSSREINPNDNDYKQDAGTLTPSKGVHYGPSGKETYYNLPMDGVINIMRNMGNYDPYWVREDGVKMLGDYVMVAADLAIRPRGSLVQTSLGVGIVCDTGDFTASNPWQIDIAVSW